MQAEERCGWNRGGWGLLPGLAVWCSLLIWMAGCAAPRAPLQAAPDEQFGHRYEGEAGRRRTVTITPPDSTREYLYHEAYVESLHVRQGPFDTTGGEVQAPVELLLKGSLSDDCTELHSAEHRRTGHLMQLNLQTRRPRAVECRRVERPFRFYFPLEGLYRPGDYTLRVGQGFFTFRVEEPPAAQGRR